jgi:hypothetical protein
MMNVDRGAMSVSRAILRPFAWALLCLASLAGCRFGEPANPFSDDTAIERAIATLRRDIGGPLRVLNLSIEPEQIVIRVQDRNNRTHVDEWRLDRVNMVAVSWDRVSGPLPYQLTLVNPDLEANLFELGEIDFSAAPALARAAIERAKLSGKPQVTRMEIARQAFLLPSPASGEIRWTVDINSERESMQVFADAHGAIVGMNVDGTERAKSLDLLRNFDMTSEAARAFRFVFGPDRILTRVNIAPQSVSFETNVSDPSPPVPVTGSLSARRTYVWSLNGLQRAMARISADAATPNLRAGTFGIDDADWTKLPAIVAAAPQELSMPQGKVTGLELAKPDNPLGSAIVLWKVQVTDQNKETGFVLADATGTVKQLIPPQSRRRPADYFDPATIAATFARLGTDFGQDRRYAEITIFNDKVVIIAEDHMQPNSFSQIILNDAGAQRVGSPAAGAVKNVPFRIGDLNMLTADRIRDLESKTIDTLKVSPISSITIGRGSMDPSPNGNVTIEIRAEERPGGRAGRVNYELDGRVIRTYLP